MYVGVFTNAAFLSQFDLLSTCKKVSGQESRVLENSALLFSCVYRKPGF